MITSELWAILPGFQMTLSQGEEQQAPAYQMAGPTAVVPIVGPTTKYGEGGTSSTLRTRSTLREVAASPGVESVLLYVDSPGGEVKGTHDLAMDVRNLSQVKPTFAYGSDLMASAAYYVASQAGQVHSNDAGFVGSIGVMSTLVDASKLLQDVGVTVHSVDSGGVKNLGTPGVAITPEHIAYQQHRINQMTDQFVDAVAIGRNMQPNSVRALADGRVHIAADAAQMGLIDGVMPLEQSIELLQRFTQFSKGQ